MIVKEILYHTIYIMGKKENRISFSKDIVVLIQALFNLESDECERQLLEYNGWHYHIYKNTKFVKPEFRVQRTNYTQNNYKGMAKRTRQTHTAWVYKEGENVSYGGIDKGYIYDGFSIQDFHQNTF